MDGLTIFIELIINRKASPTTPIPWKTLEHAYVQSTIASSGGGAGGAGGAGGKGSDAAQAAASTFWESLPLETRKAGLIVALQNTDKKDREEFRNKLNIGEITTTDLLLNYQPLFSFEAKNVSKTDALLELKYIEENYSTEYTKTNSEWPEMKESLDNLHWMYSGNYKSLASVKFVTHQYETCLQLGQKKETLKCMTEDEEQKVVQCLGQKSTSPNTALRYFQKYINITYFYDQDGFVNVEKLEATAKKELEVRNKQAQLQALNTHTLVRSDISKDLNDYLISSSDFWSVHKKSELDFAISTYLNEQDLKSSPGFLLLIHATCNVQNPQGAAALMQIALKNYLYWYGINFFDVPINAIIDALKEFQPNLNRKLKITRAENEIDTFLKFTKLDETQRKILEKIRNDYDIDSAKQFPYLATSKYIIYGSQPDTFIIKTRIEKEPHPKFKNEDFANKLQLYKAIYQFRLDYEIKRPDPQSVSNDQAVLIFEQAKFKTLKILLTQYENASADKRGVIASQYEELLNAKHDANTANATIQQLAADTSNIEKYDKMFQFTSAAVENIIKHITLLESTLPSANCNDLDDVVEQIQIVIDDPTLPEDWKRLIIEDAKGFFRNIIVQENCPDKRLTEVDKFLKLPTKFAFPTIADIIGIKQPQAAKQSAIPEIEILENDALTTKINSLAQFTQRLEILYTSSDMYEKEKQKHKSAGINQILQLACRVYHETFLSPDDVFEDLPKKYDEFLNLDDTIASDCIQTKKSSAQCTLELQKFSKLSLKFQESPKNFQMPKFPLGKTRIEILKKQIRALHVASQGPAGLIFQFLNVVEAAQLLPGDELSRIIFKFNENLKGICHAVAKKYEKDNEKLAVQLYTKALELKTTLVV